MAVTGRPTKYDPTFCETATTYMSGGKSITQLAREIGVNKSTIYEWSNTHKDFSDALQSGRELSQAFWEDELCDMMYNKDVNSPLVKLYFANRFGWTDKQQVDNTSSDGSCSGVLKVSVIRSNKD